jgi:CRP-like cAMP-binding protein
MKAFLHSLEILSDLSDAEIDLLARTAEECSFQAKETILRKGELGDAAYILMEGAAEALIEKPGSEPLRLSRIFPGDMFGEMALLDDSPRSATVLAITDCTAVKISREAFLSEVAKNPHAALKLVALITRRLRRAEDVVSDFSDRIYGDVLPRLQDAVSAQLETAKTICQETRSRTEATITQAKHIQDTVDKHWTWWTRLGSLIGILALTIGGLAGVLGYKKFDDVLAKTQEDADNAIKVITEAQSIATENLSNLTDLDILRQTVLQFDNMQRELQFEGRSQIMNAGEIAGDIALDFVNARRTLIDGYLKKAGEWESQILIEALSLFVGAIQHGYMTATKTEWDLAVDTVLAALHDPPEHWRQRTKLKEVTIDLYQLMYDTRNRQKQRELIRRLDDELASERLRTEGARQAATILAALGSNTEGVRAQLRKLLEPDVSSWRRSQAAVDLISIGDNTAWDALRKDLVAPFNASKPPIHRNGNLRSKNTQHQPQATKEQRQKEAFVAALRIAESANGPNLAGRRPEHHLRVEDINRELSADRLSAHSKSWWDKPVGTDLVGFTVLEGLRQNPDRWGRLYWQYSCGLLCELGCASPDATDGGGRCKECFDEFKKQTDNYVPEAQERLRNSASEACQRQRML